MNKKIADLRVPFWEARIFCLSWSWLSHPFKWAPLVLTRHPTYCVGQGTSKLMGQVYADSLIAWDSLWGFGKPNGICAVSCHLLTISFSLSCPLKYNCQMVEWPGALFRYISFCFQCDWTCSLGQWTFSNDNVIVMALESGGIDDRRLVNYYYVHFCYHNWPLELPGS